VARVDDASELRAVGLQESSASRTAAPVETAYRFLRFASGAGFLVVIGADRI
jgi:hypothetical protein